MLISSNNDFFLVKVGCFFKNSALCDFFTEIALFLLSSSFVISWLPRPAKKFSIGSKHTKNPTTNPNKPKPTQISQPIKSKPNIVTPITGPVKVRKSTYKTKIIDNIRSNKWEFRIPLKTFKELSKILALTKLKKVIITKTLKLYVKWSENWLSQSPFLYPALYLPETIRYPFPESYLLPITSTKKFSPAK